RASALEERKRPAPPGDRLEQRRHPRPGRKRHQPRSLRRGRGDSVAPVDPAIANFTEARGGDFEFGHMKGLWRDLGRATGTRTIGLRRIEVEPGYFSTPAHEHGADEEVFFVLDGSGLLWQNGRTYAIGAHDCI